MYIHSYISFCLLACDMQGLTIHPDEARGDFSKVGMLYGLVIFMVHHGRHQLYTIKDGFLKHILFPRKGLVVALPMPFAHVCWKSPPGVRSFSPRYQLTLGVTEAGTLTLHVMIRGSPSKTQVSNRGSITSGGSEK